MSEYTFTNCSIGNVVNKNNKEIISFLQEVADAHDNLHFVEDGAYELKKLSEKAENLLNLINN